MIFNLLETLGPWSWIIGGALLILAEMAIPGVFLVWLGLAALVTGVLDFGLGLSWQSAALSFGGLAILFVIAGRYLSQMGEPQDENIGLLNHRARQLIGQSFTLETPLANGEGRIRVADSSWRVTGPDAPAGARVKVVQTDGARLVVERV